MTHAPGDPGSRPDIAGRPHIEARPRYTLRGDRGQQKSRSPTGKSGETASSTDRRRVSGARLHQPYALAEREGFEPSVECYPYNRLAGGCLQPLGHLSALLFRFPYLSVSAEGEGLEPPRACARRISNPLPYQLGLALRRKKMTPLAPRGFLMSIRSRPHHCQLKEIQGDSRRSHSASLRRFR